MSSVITTRRRSLLAVVLKLVPDMETWHADGKDLMHVRIYAVDKKGRRVLNVKDAKAFDKLTFTVKGDANIVAGIMETSHLMNFISERPSWRSPSREISSRVLPS